MQTLSPHLHDDRSVTDDLMVQSSREGSDLFRALETVLKGPDIELPDGLEYLDPYDIERDRARRRWWDASATTLRSAAIIPSNARSRDGSPFPQLPDTPLDDVSNSPYTDNVPVIFGHYWRTDSSEDTAKTVCVDHSAGKCGPLVAYRWNEGDTALTRENLRSFPTEGSAAEDG